MKRWFALVCFVVPTCILSQNCRTEEHEGKANLRVSFCCSADYANYSISLNPNFVRGRPTVSIGCYNEFNMTVKETIFAIEHPRFNYLGNSNIPENATWCDLKVKLPFGGSDIHNDDIPIPCNVSALSTTQAPTTILSPSTTLPPVPLTTLPFPAPSTTLPFPALSTTYQLIAPSNTQPPSTFSTAQSSLTSETTESPLAPSTSVTSQTPSALPAPSTTPTTSTLDEMEVEVATLIVTLTVFLLLCVTVLLFIISSYFVFKRCYYKEKEQNSSFQNYCEKLDHEPDIDVIRKMVVSLTIDSINSEIIGIGTNLLGEDGTHRYSTEDIHNCDDDDAYSDSNSINNIHRHGSYDGYLNVCGDYRSTVTGNFNSTPGLHQSIDIVNASTSSRGSASIQNIQTSTCTLPEIHISQTSLNEDPCPAQQVSCYTFNNNDSGIDV